MLLRVGLPVLITMIVGSILVLAYFIPRDPFSTLNADFSEYFNIVAAFAFILGGGNLLKVHLEKVSQKREGWPYSIVTIGGFLIMLLAGIFKIGKTGWTDPVDANHLAFGWMYDHLFTPLQAAMFSILAFFVASASYRAFRAKNTEASLLLIAALIILLGRTFVGAWLTSWMPESMDFLTIPSLSNWIMSVVNQAGQRAILIGIGLGIMSTSLKVILGIERSYLGGE